MHQDNNFPTRCLTQSSPHAAAAAAATQWTREEDKIFEKALLVFPEDLTDRWESIGEFVGKSAWEVRTHYEILIHDVYEIDSGRIELPSYRDDEAVTSWDSGGDSGGMVAGSLPSGQISFGGKTKQDVERKKGTPWTEEEHKLFLIGLNKYGKGDWRSISRNVVITRTPTQVASHAQKYFLRQNSVKKERKRSSIHDITSVDNKAAVAPSADDNWMTPPGPPTAQIGPPGSGYQNFTFTM